MKSYVLLVPFGWNFNKILLECEPAFSGPITLDVKAGVKIDVSENIGIHLLAGIADDICLDLRPPPLQVTHLFYPAATVRIWLGKFMIQDSYINKTHLVGVGFIGFTRD